MDVLINIAIFIILLFLYLHVQNQLRRNEDLEISEIDYSDNENLQDVCELKQPLLFDYKINLFQFYLNKYLFFVLSHFYLILNQNIIQIINNFLFNFLPY